jgi:hypothetical protein
MEIPNKEYAKYKALSEQGFVGQIKQQQPSMVGHSHPMIND